MILKILLVIGVIAVVYFMFIKKKPISSKNNDTKLQANDMIECAQCGVYVEVGEAILSNGKYYCSQECLNKDK
ncbi:PP0621 family protein [Sulfurimonas sp. C5]|uniref:PP0621 family protein n=1 Tax=Sulfurimonas sp. C5 TaxID=3036947 RepID=UPI00245600AE|nr:PP0621 family protein [Sulfurimonas sp. C5]MDH4944625.1 PP0621 family protein [Sulfurimonas sp. C5]